VLRKVATEGAAVIAAQDIDRLNTPDWLLQRWTKAYGKETTGHITDAHLTEAALDLSVLGNPAEWAARLGGVVLPTGSVRVRSKGRIEALDGFAEGDWWVQDAAAAIPARLLGDVAGKRVADLCAAPGGKTAMLAAMGAQVTALDTSARRLKILQANLDRLKLHAEIVTADATTWVAPDPFDAVLLDAPCLATGTIRRHPDLPYLKRPSDLKSLAQLQSRLLDSAARILKPGGTLVYCTCSLEPEEGPEQIAQLLARMPELTVSPIRPDAYGLSPDWLTEEGYLRTLPFHLPMQPPELSGLDGFFAARLVRAG
jgi:16S rRNA (cytosine967-C5)-methyltransferase